MEYACSVQSGLYRESGRMVLVLFSTEIGVHPPAGDAGMYRVQGAITISTIRITVPKTNCYSSRFPVQPVRAYSLTCFLSDKFISPVKRQQSPAGARTGKHFAKVLFKYPVKRPQAAYYPRQTQQIKKTPR